MALTNSSRLDSLADKGLRTQLAAAFALTSLIPAMVVAYFVVNYIVPQTKSLAELYSVIGGCLLIAALGSALLVRIARQVQRVTAVAREFSRASESHGENEMLQLDAAVSDMAATLQQQVTELQEKTRQLTVLNTKLEEAKRQLAQFTQMKSGLVLLATREFRTPIGAIVEAAGLVLNRQLGDINEKQHRMLSLIHTNACKAGRLLQELLSLTRVQTEGRDLDCREIDLAQTIQAILARASAETERKALSISLATPAGANATIRSFEHETTLALDCLFSNAIQLAAENTTLKVAVSAANHHAEISVEIQTLSVTAHSFERIVPTLNNETAALSDWSGCGSIELPLAKEIIQFLGGHIHIEHAPGNVIGFRVSLPNGVDANAGSTP